MGLTDRRRAIVLFGDSLTQRSFEPGGWGATPFDPSGAALPLAFRHACHVCVVHVLPTGARPPCLLSEICPAIGVPIGSPLPRLVTFELRRSGGACLFLREGRRADGSP